MLKQQSHRLKINNFISCHIKIETIFTLLPYCYLTHYDNNTVKRDTHFLNIAD